MPRVTQTRAIVSTGTGDPDYKTEVSRGVSYSGIGALKANERLLVFGVLFSDLPSVWAWRKASLAVGASAHLVNFETGLDTPYRVPPGYTGEILSILQTFDQPVHNIIYIDSILGVYQPVSEIPVATTRGMNYANPLLNFGTNLIDPTGLTEHYYDVVGTNEGLGPAHGSGYIVGILTRIGSEEYPKTKKVKCHICGEMNEVPDEAMQVICKCGGVTFVAHFGWGKGTQPMKPKVKVRVG